MSRPPLLFASVSGADRDAVARLAQQAVDDGADVVELRADRCPERDPAALRRWIPDGIPACYTVRSIAHGGDFAGGESAAIGLREQATAAEFDWIDVEAPVDAADALPPLPSGVRTILSLHDPAGTPKELSARCTAMRAHGADVVKIIGTAHRPEDAGPLLALHAGAADVAAWCMGEAGLPSRVLALRAGAALMFGAADAAAPAAPGQIPIRELVERYRLGALTGRTMVYGVAGNPIAHSRGPALHNAIFAAARVDAIYLPVWTADLAPTFAFLGAHGLQGLSVTIPHKRDAGALAADLSAEAQQAGSVNTLTLRDGRWGADSTDGAGLVAALTERVPGGFRGTTVRILGAGGTARSAAVALHSAGAIVEVSARDAEAAISVAAACGGTVREWDDRNAPATVLINATPLGMHAADPLPSEPATVRGLVAALDAVYTPPWTPWLRAVEAAGAQAVSGVRMFLHQAHAQQRLWAEARGADVPSFANVEAAWETVA